MKATRIYLIGYMASGKSWLGRQLASATGMGFTDLDELFEERYRVSILDFFEKYGEPLFRRLERGLLLETVESDRMIIATGGGTPCYSDNMDVILKSGTSLYLRISFPELIKRIRVIRRKRPLLKGISPSELPSFVRDQLAVREPFYSRADYTFDGPDYTAEEIMRLLGLTGG